MEGRPVFLGQPEEGPVKVGSVKKGPIKAGSDPIFFWGGVNPLRLLTIWHIAALDCFYIIN